MDNTWWDAEAAGQLTEDRRRGAIILAGGDSKRLGQPKALLAFCGSSLIEFMVNRLGLYFQEITVVTDCQDQLRGLQVRLISDLLTIKEKSPLRGIHAGLSASDLPYQFVAACDMPLLNLELIRYMSEFAPYYDAVVPRIDKYFQPLHAFYSRSCIDKIEQRVKQGRYKVTAFYDGLNIKYIGPDEIMRFDPKQESFININTWLDYEQITAIISNS